MVGFLFLQGNYGYLNEFGRIAEEYLKVLLMGFVLVLVLLIAIYLRPSSNANSPKSNGNGLAPIFARFDVLDQKIDEQAKQFEGLKANVTEQLKENLWEMVEIVHDRDHYNAMKIQDVSKPTLLCGDKVSSFGACFEGKAVQISVSHPNCSNRCPPVY